MKRLKGKRQKVELCDLLSFPQSVGSAASDTFMRAATQNVIMGMFHPHARGVRRTSD